MGEGAKKSHNFADTLYECFLVVRCNGRPRGNLEEQVARAAHHPDRQCPIVVLPCASKC